MLIKSDKHFRYKQGSPDLKAGREVADYLGTVHHEFHFTVQVPDTMFCRLDPFQYWNWADLTIMDCFGFFLQNF